MKPYRSHRDLLFPQTPINIFYLRGNTLHFHNRCLQIIGCFQGRLTKYYARFGYGYPAKFEAPLSRGFSNN